MSIRSILLLTLLIIYSYSYYEKNIIIEDYEKCGKASSSYSTTTEECTAITPTLIGTGDFESQCCRLTVTIDPFERFKSKYGENWKQKYMEILGINEEQLEKEIDKRYSSAEKISFCNALIKKFKNVDLYRISFGAYNGEISYNCGDEEKTFKPKDFYPITEEEKVYKDEIDCNVQEDEKQCINKAYKLSSYNSQSCWCKQQFISYNGYSEGCHRYSINDFKNELKIFMEKNKNYTITMKCSCLNKEGKHVNAFANLVTSEIIIE